MALMVNQAEMVSKATRVLKDFLVTRVKRESLERVFQSQVLKEHEELEVETDEKESEVLMEFQVVKVTREIEDAPDQKATKVRLENKVPRENQDEVVLV